MVVVHNQGRFVAVLMLVFYKQQKGYKRWIGRWVGFFRLLIFLKVFQLIVSILQNSSHSAPLPLQRRLKELRILNFQKTQTHLHSDTEYLII